MRPISCLLIVVGALAGAVACGAPAGERAAVTNVEINAGRAEAFDITKMPPGYRDWKLISVAREEGSLDDVRAVLGNETAIKAYRDGALPFPDGSVIARLAWSYESSEENNKAFGRSQSFVAGAPKNGVQFMIKDSKKYAATGGWGYAQFNDGQPVAASMLQTCAPCHDAVPSRDRVFTRYAP